jgi:IS1 family transposase
VIGGPGCTVEIDETLAIKRKYNRGRVLRDGWLFGGIEQREDNVFRCFIQMVYNRSEAHLTNLIRRHVAPGTHIITDGWAAYQNLSAAEYTHSVVIHEQNFVSPNDDQTHTQKIESTWSSLKRFIRSRGTNKGDCYLEYVCEYMFRRRHVDVFEGLLNAIRMKYAFNTE